MTGCGIASKLKGTLIFLFVAVFIGFPALPGFCQDTQHLLGEVTQIYTGNAASNGLIGGFSIWGLVGGVLFGGIGFIAFIYGKKNSEFKPMLIGIALMVYPYFLRGTLMLYVVGIALTAALYFFRE